MRHPAGLLTRHPGEQHARLGDLQVGAAELPHLRLLDASAELVDEQLHPVADAENRHAEVEQAVVERGSARRVDRRGTAREDYPARPARGDLLQGNVMRQKLAEDATVANPPGDQLRVLTAVVEYHDLLLDA